MTPTTCAAIVARRSGPGRPAIYCSPTCRPPRPQPKLVVEVDHPDTSPDGRRVQRVWSVRLRRGQRIVVIADDLGRPSARALAGQLEDLLRPTPAPKGGPIE